jgi:predicted nucleic acid-binding protein
MKTRPGPSGVRELEFLPCSNIFLPTLETFRLQSPAGLSFADAAIATVARKRPPGYVATFNRGFEGLDGISVVAE